MYAPTAHSDHEARSLGLSVEIGMLEEAAPELMADLPGSDPPTAQELSLIFGDVLVEDVHVPASSG